MKLLFTLVFMFSNIAYSSNLDSIKLLSTTSTRDSGLLEYLLPNFERRDLILDKFLFGFFKKLS